MLWFEREVVGALVTHPDQSVRSSVEAFVDGSLRDMPEPIRAGVAAESILLGAYAAFLRSRGRLDGGQLVDMLDRWERSRIDFLRQWVRMMKSLVLFAEHELTAGPTTPEGTSPEGPTPEKAA